MDFARPIEPRCFFVAWIFSWVTAIYVPSALVALSDLSPLTEGRNLISAIFAVADEVSPAAKIGFAVILAALMVAARKLITPSALLAAVVDMLLALLAMVVMLTILPREWSRGFGIGLSGTRFALDATTIYVVGGLLSGLVFSVSEARCSVRPIKASNS